MARSAFGRERESGGDSEDLRQHVAQLVEHFLRDTLANEAEDRAVSKQRNK